MRRFILVGQRARTARDFPLDDICGAGGRWDLLARCVQATLFIAHDLRRDSELVIVALGPPDPPKSIRVVGREARNLNPDERSTVALLSRALELHLPANGREVGSSPGIYASRRDREQVLDSCGDSHLVLLDEQGDVDGKELPSVVGADDATLVLGDDMGLTEEQLASVRTRGATEVCLGPMALHADHCIAIVHNLLDRAESSD
jgi:tRNA (pseudouridine54-N1)-methyltransferase